MHLFKHVFICISLISFLVSCSKSQTNSIEIDPKADFDTFVEAQFVEQEMPGLSVLIFNEEAIQYEKNLGFSNIENNIALSENAIFLMASVSKMITGTAILQLYEQGKFDLDDPINDYLSFAVNVPNHSKAITFRMLLTHTSAIEDGPNAELFYSYGQDSPIGLKEYMQKYLVSNGEYYDAQDNFYDYEPGSQFNYSNIGSALMGVLVTEISGKDFKVYCRDHIFQPLNMNDTYWSLDAALQSGKTLVTPYEYENGTYEAIQHYTFADYPNGGLRSSARDLMKFLSALAQNGIYNDAQILNSGTVQEMLKLQIPSIDSTMGLHIFKMNTSENIWGHDGSEQGVTTDVGFSTSSKIGVLILTNLKDVDTEELFSQAYLLGSKL